MSTTPNRGYRIPPCEDAIHPAVRDALMDIDADVNSLSGGVAAALDDPGANGIVVRTSLGVTVARSLTQPAAGLTISNNDGVSGNPTFALANDLAALEGLSGTGFAKRTGTDTWSVGALVSGDIPDLSGTYQPLDADLTAIAALAGTSGLLKKIGADTWSLDTSAYATQAYADALVVGLLDDRGNFDASGNVFPSSGGSGSAGAILKGDLWTISVAGTLGGHPVTAGDVVRALADTPGQTDANWAIGENNFGYVALNQALADGKIYIGNGSGIGTAVTPSGDVTFSNAGVTAIGALKVTNAMLAGSIDLTTKVTGILPSANGGTGINNAGRTLTINTNSGTLAFGAGKTLTINNSIALTGTDSTVMTFPSTSATIARTDAAQTFTGNQTFAGHILPSLPDTSDIGAALTPFRKGWISELDATLFAQNTISVIGGWLIVTKDEGTVDEDVDNSETQIDFGANNIVANDFIVFRAAGAVEYMQATSLVSGTTWNVTRNVDGSGANAWPQGSVWVNFGYNGTGRIELNANSTPRISMLRQGTTYNTQTELLRAGDLNGWSNYASEIYGFATGDPSAANITIDATNGIRIRHGTTNKIVLDASGNASFTGSVTAVGGKATLNGSGLSFETADSLTQFANSITWLHSTTKVSQLTQAYDSVGNHWSDVNLIATTKSTDTNAGSFARVRMIAHNDVNDEASIDIVMYGSGSARTSHAVIGATTGFQGLAVGTPSFPLGAMLTVFGNARFGNGSATPASGFVVQNSDATGAGLSLALYNESTATNSYSAIKVYANNGALEGQLLADGLGGTGAVSYIIRTVSNHPIIFGTNATARMTLGASGGLTIGSPTGGNKGDGSINAVTVWRNGTSLDRVFEDSYDLLSIDKMASYFRENKHLPTIPTREVHDEGSTNMGALTDRLWETVEVQARYISQLHERLNVLESRP